MPLQVQSGLLKVQGLHRLMGRAAWAHRQSLKQRAAPSCDTSPRAAALGGAPLPGSLSCLRRPSCKDHVTRHWCTRYTALVHNVSCMLGQLAESAMYSWGRVLHRPYDVMCGRNLNAMALAQAGKRRRHARVGAGGAADGGGGRR